MNNLFFPISMFLIILSNLKFGYFFILYFVSNVFRLQAGQFKKLFNDVKHRMSAVILLCLQLSRPRFQLQTNGGESSTKRRPTSLRATPRRTATVRDFFTSVKAETGAHSLLDLLDSPSRTGREEQREHGAVEGVPLRWDASSPRVVTSGGDQTLEATEPGSSLQKRSYFYQNIITFYLCFVGIDIYIYIKMIHEAQWVVLTLQGSRRVKNAS